jgi:hypothetical protein
MNARKRPKTATMQEVEISDEAYESLITEIYGTLKIGYIEFEAGRVLRELDPIAFRVGKSEEPLEWECGECGERYKTEEEAEDCDYCEDPTPYEAEAGPGSASDPMPWDGR